jgi:presenilin 1
MRRLIVENDQDSPDEMTELLNSQADDILITDHEMPHAAVLPDVAIIQTSAIGENISSNAATASSHSRVEAIDPQDQETTHRHRRDGNSDEQRPLNSDHEEIFKYGASHVVKLFVPVSICMLIVILTIKTTSSYTPGGATWAYTPFTEDKPTNTQRILFSLANTFIFMGFVITATIILILLYKFKCYKIIHGWLILTTLMLLFFFQYSYFSSISASLNRPIDMITICFITWNIGVVGMFCIHWQGPLRVQQAYLILMSALLALVFYKFLPDWTGWLILGVISIWDLIAVLCPKGPLRILVETAQERGEPIFPALIYSSTIVYMITAVDPPSEPQYTSINTNTNNAVNVDEPLTEEQRNERVITRNNNARRQLIPRSDVPQNGTRREPARYVIERSNSPVPDDDDDEKGVKLGLGDFIFYSILLAKASALGDWNVTIACYVSLLIGLCLTLLLLAIFRKALPALPISITFGLVLYFSTVYIIGPFSAELSLEQVFI